MNHKMVTLDGVIHQELSDVNPKLIVAGLKALNWRGECL